mmetsp:Transcript_47596/g.95891  ORF Transcript_47596/g.95891 Transcript_47596/m.95891 type:complete len:250 (-) Transcript_47596:4434-5183(-)
MPSFICTASSTPSSASCTFSTASSTRRDAVMGSSIQSCTPPSTRCRATWTMPSADFRSCFTLDCRDTPLPSAVSRQSVSVRVRLSRRCMAPVMFLVACTTRARTLLAARSAWSTMVAARATAAWNAVTSLPWRRSRVDALTALVASKSTSSMSAATGGPTASTMATTPCSLVSTLSRWFCPSFQSLEPVSFRRRLSLIFSSATVIFAVSSAMAYLTVSTGWKVDTILLAWSSASSASSMDMDTSWSARR